MVMQVFLGNSNGNGSSSDISGYIKNSDNNYFYHRLLFSSIDHYVIYNHNT